MNRIIFIVAVLCCSQAQAEWRWNRSTCRYYWYAAPVVAKVVPNYTTYNYTVNNSYVPQPQGGTQYTLSGLTQVYANTDVGALYQQASLLAKDSQAYGAQAVAGTQLLASQLGNAQLRVAEAVAVGEAVREAFRAARPANSATIYTQQAQGYQQQNGYQTQGYMPAQNGGGVQAVEQKCQSCHSRDAAPSRAKNIVLPLFSQMTPPQISIVRTRVSTHDASRVMPPGEPLSEPDLYALNALFDEIICRPQTQVQPQPQYQNQPTPATPQAPPTPPTEPQGGAARAPSGVFAR